MSNYSSGYSPIANFLPDSIQYGKLAEQSVKDRYGEVNTAMVADGLVKNTLTEADATKKMAEYEAEAVKARGAAAGKAAIWKGIGSAAGSIGSSFASNMGSSNPFRNPGAGDIAVDANSDFANAWKGDKYWDSDMDVDTTILR